MSSTQPLAMSFPVVKKTIVEITAASTPFPPSPDILMSLQLETTADLLKLCVHSSLCSVQSHLDAMDYHQLGFKVTQLVLPWNVQGGDYQTWFMWLSWGESNHEQKDGETQTFPIMIDVSEFGMASLIFQEQRKKLWKIQRYLSDSCRTEMSNEITLLLFVPTSI